MHTAWNRAYAVVGYFLYCMGAVLPLVALAGSGARAPPSVSVSVESVSNRLGIEDYFMNRRVMLTDVIFSVDADFAPLFHWNTKQLFVYATLEYASPTHARNEVVLWDKILPASAPSKRLSLDNVRNKYALTDVEDGLPGTEAVLRVHWNTVPHVGFLRDTSRGSVSVRVPRVGEASA